MIIKSITLEGIRSYKDETPIPISTGTTLFEGDIASGKSTILYAIEFALFGLGSFKGTFLLNNKAKRGWVTLLFEADGKEYQVHRALERKGKGVQQVDGYIKGPGGKIPMAAGELKEKVLQLLKFNEPPNAKAQSVIYRYAIFTPQEEMKSIIQKEADERLQTLRRAFGIEQYKTASQNSSVVASKIKGRTDFLQGATSDIGDIRRKLEQETTRIKVLEEGLKPLEAREDELRSRRDKERESLKSLEKVREKIKNAESRIPLIRREMEGKAQQRENLLQENNRLSDRIKREFEPMMKELQHVLPVEKSREELRKELRDTRSKKEAASKLSSKLEERLANVESILEKNVCPVCEREVEEKDFATKGKHLKEEMDSLEKEIERLGKINDEVETLIEQARAYEDAQKELVNVKSLVEENEAKVRENVQSIRELKPVIEELKTQLESAEGEVKPLQGILERIGEMEGKVSGLESDLQKAGEGVASVRASIVGSKENRAEFQGELDTKERQVKIAESLVEHRIWLTEYLAPTIENIEVHVMTNLNQRFDLQFQKWFQILMDDPDLRVRVDEDFTPVIEREGYAQEYVALSGGERTSVALAYRLALNTMVQEVATGEGSNLLILDEPTDGFSKEQLSKVRDVLKELKCPQVILVSHERELEAFADQIVRITKVDGISKVDAGAAA